VNILSYLMESRGIMNAAQRLPVIAVRFGVSAGKMERALLDYASTAMEFGATPTLFVTGNLLERYPDAFRTVSAAGVEFGLHGYVHTDYARLPFDRQKQDLARTMAAFERIGIHPAGFRGPYLRWNADSVTAARQLGLEFGSNRGIAWDVLPTTSANHSRRLQAYKKALRLYGALESAQTLSLPATIHGLLDLPASLPDDEAIVDRLRLSRKKRERVWRSLVREAHATGELLVHTLHHERLQLCKPALRGMLEETRSLSPRVWLASLREIAAWWRRRSHNPLTVERQGDGLYTASTPLGDEATILVRNVDAPGARDWHHGWKTIAPGATIRSTSAPWIELPPGASPALVRFLEDEGFVVRAGAGGAGPALLGKWAAFRGEDARAVLQEIDRSNAPIVRLWRWPRGARCAASLTGDVDSMSLLDFIRRPLEV